MERTSWIEYNELSAPMGRPSSSLGSAWSLEPRHASSRLDVFRVIKRLPRVQSLEVFRDEVADYARFEVLRPRRLL